MATKTLDDIVSTIRDKGFLTGSRAMWGATKDSDYDYCLLQEEYENVRTQLKKLSIEYVFSPDYGDTNGLTFIFESKKINVIGLSKKDLGLWTDALLIMNNLPLGIKNKLKAKVNRKDFYRSIVDSLRMCK